MDIDHYLKRLQIDIAGKPDYFFLEKLVHQHLINIPFENLSVRKGRTIFLEEDFLYQKIITQGRGGFCYELNGLFGWLLKKLGYHISLVSAEVYVPSESKYSSSFDHLSLLVHLDETYIVDVGFGEAFRKPILLNRGTVKDVSGIYQVFTPGPNQKHHVIKKQENNAWQPIYRLETIPRKLVEFSDMCHYNSNSPDSQFTQNTICTLANKNGRVTLTEDSLIITRLKEKKSQPVASFDNFKALLLKSFDMDYDMI